MNEDLNPTCKDYMSIFESYIFLQVNLTVTIVVKVFLDFFVEIKLIVVCKLDVSLLVVLHVYYRIVIVFVL